MAAALAVTFHVIGDGETFVRGVGGFGQIQSELEVVGKFR